ncbi:hypothetical protein [Bernardetia sp. MNP-M8]|uniref:hypothetical protein n=1 Tax=Bernardetia sp. MNP-M8 TaxID=3127470 RepID=UPI0030CFE6C3
MTYLLIFLLIVCLFYLLKKQLRIKKLKRIILQHELRKERFDALMDKMFIDGNLDTQIDVLEHRLQTIQDYETNRQNTPSVR